MAVTIKGFSNFPKNALKELVGDLSNAGTTVKCSLHTSSYSPDQENDEFFDDVDNEVTGTGYTAGGDELTTKAVTEASRVTTFDADNAQWTSSTITARYAIIYVDTGTPATSALICWIDFGEDKSSENGTFEIQFDAAGILTLTVPA